MQRERENEVQPTYDNRQGNKAGDISNSEFSHSSLMQTDHKHARISKEPRGFQERTTAQVYTSDAIEQ
jgi:hypothetical protein